MIRPYIDTDRDSVIALFRQFMDELTPPERRADFAAYVERAIEEELGRIGEYYLGRSGQGFWVADSGGVIGMVGIERESGEAAELRRMAVETSHRRRGIARALLAHAEAFCREQGYRKIVLNTSERQAAARRLYESSGYRYLAAAAPAETTHKRVGGLKRYYYEKRL
jgi:GNAT superfamily N-acetyltransferase